MRICKSHHCPYCDGRRQTTYGAWGVKRTTSTDTVGKTNHSRGAISPLLDWESTGRVTQTLVGGEIVFELPGS